MRVPSLLVLPLLLAGCGFATGEEGDDRPTVVTSIYPLQYVAERLVGDDARVVNLTAPGQESHDLELTVQQTAELSEADVVVHLDGYQPAVDEAVEQNAGGSVVDVGEVVALRPADADAHAGESEEEHAEHDSDVDPHFWLDPARLATVGDAVADALVEAEPELADGVETRLADLEQDLEALDRDLREGLADCDVDTVVVSHDAFGYLEERGLEFAPIAGLSPQDEPSPRHIAELQELARAEGVTTVFYDRLASPDTAQALASDLGLRTAVLDPLEGLSDETSDEDYLSLMRANLDALQEAQGCR